MPSQNDKVVYITRGALLECSLGSHPRRLNMPRDNGLSIITEDGEEHPMVEESDCKIGPNENIDYFGVCSKAPEGAPNIVLKPYVPEGEEPQKDAEPIEGGKCIPCIEFEKWMDTKSDVYIEDGVYRNAVTTKSMLLCSCGGCITPKTSGIEYKGEKDSK